MGLDVRSHSARSEGELVMPVTIEIPTAFRRFTEGAPRVDCSGTTIAEAINELSALDRVLGSMRPRIVIYALASLLLLAFHAPFRALAFLISEIRDPRPLQRTAR